MTAGDKAANAFGGKTARACDSCLRRRARWYCAADDAFLCQGCDTSVHSANQLARRHERVRLDTASSKGGNDNLTNPKFVDNTVSVPAWHHGFTRKARTPRNGNKKSEAERAPKPSPGELVPEISNELDENELEEHLLCRVPEFDPFAADDATAAGNDDHDFIIGGGDDVISDLDINALFLPSELDFAEFAADVESLLGKGMEEFEPAVDIMKVKGEVEEEAALLGDGDAACQFGIAVAAETVGDWGDFGGRLPVLEEEEKKEIEEENCEAEKKLLLQLNYEDVMAAWASQGSPWTTGCRPDIGAGDDWPDCMGTCASDIHHQHPYGDILGLRLLGGGADDKGREARVSRYREKRRTRMFSKKIRYQVRKLNAEKRPRMKGRFVKRTSSSLL